MSCIEVASLENTLAMEEPSIDTDQLSYEIFSILESKFLFGYDDQKLWIPKQISSEMDSKHETHTAETVTSIRNQRGKICILSIDGSGMRGILSGKALSYLEQALKTKSGNPEARIADYFDVAAGAGTGGIFTAMLFAANSGTSRPIFTADDTWKFLADQGKFFYKSCNGNKFLRRLFSSSTEDSAHSASTSRFETIMKESFRDLTLKDTLKPILVPCYDLSSSAPFLFSRADALETDSFDFKLWEVCRATVAEPGMFEPVAMVSVDGRTKCLGVDGRLAMSSPAAAAITHVLHNKQEFPFVRGVEDLLVLSLGSGQLSENSYEYEEVRKWKAKQWAKPLARITSDGSADLVDHAVALAFGRCRSCNYVRIQANGSKLGRFMANVDSDPSPRNVKMLMEVAEEMLNQKNVESVLFGGKMISDLTNYQKLDWFAGELVLEHQRRSCRKAPTVAFKQAPLKPA